MKNLSNEGVAGRKMHFVGNVMIDTLLRHRASAESSDIRARIGLNAASRYALVTLHRRSNVDNPEKLAGLVRALGTISDDLAVVFPIHPRTRKNPSKPVSSGTWIASLPPTRSDISTFST